MAAKDDIVDDISTDRYPITSLQGHDEVLASMLAAAKQDRLHHAWVLSGPTGIGKARLAFEFAAQLIATFDSGPSLFGDGAGHESQIQVEKNLVFNQTHPDFLYVDSEISETNKSGQIRVEQIRKINQFLANSSARGGWRVVVIDSMDAVNLNGANALLKILEEPPNKTVIFLLSSSKSRLLPTIKSRCHMQVIKPLSHAKTLHVLQQIFEDADTEYLSQLATLSAGAPGQAVFLSDSGALDAYEQSCQIFAHNRSNIHHMMMLGALWGEGGVRAAPKRQAGAYLFDRLFSVSAVASARQVDLSGYLPYEIEAIQSLSEGFSPEILAEFHQDIAAIFQNTTQFYLDAAAVFQPFLLKLYNISNNS